MTLPSAKQRMPVVDALKAVACLAIVAHHLAFYGPMSDVAQPLVPQLISWLYDYGRMAVQIFLVMAGFLTGGQLLAQAQRDEPLAWLGAVWQRYLRLAIPYVVALLAAMLAAALVRPWLHHESVPGQPVPLQVLSHVFMLQNWLDQEALSAGVWYVAIDLQLFAIASALLWLAQRLPGQVAGLGRRGAARRAEGAMVWLQSLTFCGVIASLFFFNRDADLDHTGLYFFGAYGMGLLVRWALGHRRPAWSLLALVALAALALMIDFRLRILVALVAAMLLAMAGLSGGWAWASNAVLAWLARISYSVFLIHFPVCLLVSACWQHFLPALPWVHLAGMGVALGLSVAAGHLFWGLVEARGGTRLLGLLVASAGR